MKIPKDSIWTEFLVNPKDHDKHIASKEIGDGIWEFSSSANTLPQRAPIVKHCKISNANLQFFSVKPFHSAAPNLAAAVALAISSCSAVRFEAENIISAFMTIKGFVAKSEASNREFLRRKKLPCSATEILKSLLKDCGLDHHVKVGLLEQIIKIKEKYETRSFVTIIPNSTENIQIAESVLNNLLIGIDLGKKPVNISYKWKKIKNIVSSSKYIDDDSGNFVKDYMNKHVKKGMFVPAVTLKEICSKIESNQKYSSSYKNSLKSTMCALYSSDFLSVYRKAANSERVYGVGASLQTIPSWIRRELFPNWIELDYANLHLDLANRKFGLNFDLKTSFWETIWNECIPHFQNIYFLPTEQMPTETAAYLANLKNTNITTGEEYSKFYLNKEHTDLAFLKPIIKEFVYSTLYGKSSASHISCAFKKLLEANVDSAQALYTARIIAGTPTFKKLSTAIQKHLERTTPTELAAEFQKLETDLIHKVYDLVEDMGSDKALISVHSHDGVSIVVSSEEAFSELNQKIESDLNPSLEKEGLSTKLIIKYGSAKIENSATTKTIAYTVKKDISSMLIRFTPLKSKLLQFSAPIQSDYNKWIEAIGPPC